MTRPLNPFLHERLTSVFESVQIRNEGESMRGRYVPDVKGRRFIVDVPGEYYVVSCPFCNDTRNRLWVNHVYGVPDQCGDSRFWAAHCFNEDCLSEPAYRKDLITRVYGGISRDQRRSVRIRPGTIATSGQQFALPGHCPPSRPTPGKRCGSRPTCGNGVSIPRRWLTPTTSASASRRIPDSQQPRADW